MRNYVLKSRTTGNNFKDELGKTRFFPNREAAREVKRRFELNDHTISRGPDHPYVKASPDKGMHPKRKKANVRAFI